MGKENIFYRSVYFKIINYAGEVNFYGLRKCKKNLRCIFSWFFLKTLSFTQTQESIWNCPHVFYHSSPSFKLTNEGERERKKNRCCNKTSERTVALGVRSLIHRLDLIWCLKNDLTSFILSLSPSLPLSLSLFVIRWSSLNLPGAAAVSQVSPFFPVISSVCET